MTDLTWLQLLRRMHTAGYRMVYDDANFWHTELNDEVAVSYLVSPLDESEFSQSVGEVYRMTFEDWVLILYGHDSDGFRVRACIKDPLPEDVLAAARHCGLLTEEATHE